VERHALRTVPLPDAFDGLICPAHGHPPVKRETKTLSMNKVKPASPQT
jgi:hypothetical protein